MLFLFCQKCIILRRVIQYSSYIDKFKEYYSLLKKFIYYKKDRNFLFENVLLFKKAFIEKFK